MNIQELGTIAQYNLPIKMFVMNNSSLGMISKTQIESYSKKYQSDMLNPDFTQIARAYGILGYKISTKNQLEKALSEIFVCKKPVLLDITTVL